MTERLEKIDLVDLVSERVDRDVEMVAEIVDAFIDEICEAFKRGECVSLRGLGWLYVRPERDSRVFKFNPSQRLRKMLARSSIYRGQP